ALHETEPQTWRLQAKRIAERSPDALDCHEQRMISSNVVGKTVLDRILPQAVSTAGSSQMNQADVRKTTGPPTKHVCFNQINRVPARSHYQSSDGRKTLAAINLRGATNMKRRLRGEFRHHLSIYKVAERPACNPKFRVSL